MINKMVQIILIVSSNFKCSCVLKRVSTIEKYTDKALDAYFHAVKTNNRRLLQENIWKTGTQEPKQNLKIFEDCFFITQDTTHART